jgi:hypothetical protein
MRCYSHLSDDEREQIGLAKAVGHSIGAIAKAIGRPKSTVSRELLPSRQGRSYVGLARAEGGKKSSIACPSQQGVANHLSMAFCRERSTAHSCRRRHGLQSNRIEAPTRVVRVQASWRRNKLNYLRARAEERAFLRPYASGLPFSYRSGCGHERLTGCGRCPSPT